MTDLIRLEWDTEPGRICLFGGYQVVIEPGDMLIGFLLPGTGVLVPVDFESRPAFQRHHKEASHDRSGSH